MSTLDQLLGDGPLTLAGPGHRLVLLGRRPIARLHEGSPSSAFAAYIGRPSALMDLLGTLAAPRPTAVLALCPPDDATHPLALYVKDGIVEGVVGEGPLDNAGAWALEFRSRFGLGTRASDRDGDLTLMFFTERILGALEASDRRGGTLVSLQGNFDWLGDARTAEQGLQINHLLLEFARRSDELPRLEAKIDTNSVVIPLAEPGDTPGPRTRGGSRFGLDFHTDMDDAAIEEWMDARRVFRMCDGGCTVEDLIQRALIGRFRTLGAVLALSERSHVQLVAVAQDLVANLDIG